MPSVKKTRPAYRAHTPPRLRKPQTIAARRASQNLDKTLRLQDALKNNPQSHLALTTTLRGSMIAILSGSAGGLTYSLSTTLMQDHAKHDTSALKAEQRVDASPPPENTPAIDYASPVLGLFAAGIAAFASYPFIKREQRMWDQFDDCAETILSHATKAKKTLKNIFSFTI